MILPKRKESGEMFMREIYQAWLEGMNHDDEGLELFWKPRFLTGIMLLVLLFALALYILFLYQVVHGDTEARNLFFAFSILCFLASAALGVHVDKLNATERKNLEQQRCKAIFNNITEEKGMDAGKWNLVLVSCLSRLGELHRVRSRFVTIITAAFEAFFAIMLALVSLAIQPQMLQDGRVLTSLIFFIVGLTLAPYFIRYVIGSTWDSLHSQKRYTEQAKNPRELKRFTEFVQSMLLDS